MHQAQPIIRAEAVAIERPLQTDGALHARRILSGVSFAVPASGRLAIFGPSGSGKTSLLRCLNRLDDPADGQILFHGQDLRTLDPIALRRQVGMVFQQPFLFDATVEENLAYPLRLARRDLPGERAAALLAQVGLPEDYLARRATQLSGGEQQRVALARALMLDPEVLLLDEPTSALDETSARVMMEALLRRNTEHGLALIMITHAPEMVRRLDGPTLVVGGGGARWLPDADAALAAARGEQMVTE